MGLPKALLTSADGTPWVVSALQVLRQAGCAPLVVVLGAEYERVRALVAEADVRVVYAEGWETGMGASLRAGVAEVVRTAPQAESVMVHLVDLPDVGPQAAHRVAAHSSPSALVRALYASGPGHPVLIGRDHLDGVIEVAFGDRGARDYLASRHVSEVDCSDLAGGADIDDPMAYRRQQG